MCATVELRGFWVVIGELQATNIQLQPNVRLSDSASNSEPKLCKPSRYMELKQLLTLCYTSVIQDLFLHIRTTLDVNGTLCSHGCNCRTSEHHTRASSSQEGRANMGLPLAVTQVGISFSIIDRLV